MENQNILCEFCKKAFTKTTILRHIGKSHQCKLHYGSRFMEMKKSNNNEKMKKWREENKEKELKNQRELYAKNTEKKEKKRQNYEEKQSKLAKEEGRHYVSNHECMTKKAKQNDEKDSLG